MAPSVARWPLRASGVSLPGAPHELEEHVAVLRHDRRAHATQREQGVHRRRPRARQEAAVLRAQLPKGGYREGLGARAQTFVALAAAYVTTRQWPTRSRRSMHAVRKDWPLVAACRCLVRERERHLKRVRRRRVPARRRRCSSSARTAAARAAPACAAPTLFQTWTASSAIGSRLAVDASVARGGVALVRADREGHGAASAEEVDRDRRIGVGQVAATFTDGRRRGR